MSSGLDNWGLHVGQSLSQLNADLLGYPPDDNSLRGPPTRIPVGLPDELIDLFAVCDGGSLPDVHIGYFIDSAARVCSAAARGEPVQVVGDLELSRIHVFASDGGGGRFALAIPEGCVYYLPSSGMVVNGSYQADEVATPRQVAKTMVEFLWLLAADIDAFVQAKDGHRYLAN